MQVPLAQNGWSRDVMLMQIENGYIHAKGHATNNFEQTFADVASALPHIEELEKSMDDLKRSE